MHVAAIRHLDAVPWQAILQHTTRLTAVNLWNGCTAGPQQQQQQCVAAATPPHLFTAFDRSGSPLAALFAADATHCNRSMRQTTHHRSGHILDWLRQPRVKAVTLRLATVLAAAIATLAVVMALALDCPTPWIEGTRFCDPLHRSTDSAASWNQRCATRAAAALPELPGVCLSSTASSQEGCPADPMRVTWLQKSSVRPSAMQPRWEADPSITSQTDAITAWCSFRDVDLTLYTATVFCWLEFWGRYRNGTRFVADPSMPAKNGSSDASTLGNTTLVLLLGGSKVEYKNGDVPLGVEFPLSLGQWWRRPEHVNAEYYPYTNLPFSLEFTAWWSSAVVMWTAAQVSRLLWLNWNSTTSRFMQSATRAASSTLNMPVR